MADPGDLTGAAAARSALRKAQGEALTRRMALPSLHLLIWPTPSAVRLSLVIYYSTPGQRRACKVLRQAEWNPKEVTEQALIQWGIRAMRGWLEEDLLKEKERLEADV